MEIKIKENLRSSAFWISAAAFILLMLHTFGITVVDARYNQVFNAILGLLTILGLFNAPQTVTTPITTIDTETFTPAQPISIPIVPPETPTVVTKVATVIYTKEDGTPLQEVTKV